MAILLVNFGGSESMALYGEQKAVELRKILDNPAQWKNADFLNNIKKQKKVYNFNLAPRASELVKNRLNAKNLI